MYNVIVGALFCVLAWAVYYVVLVVLEPFLLPLFWAGLTGFVIHPYKTTFTEFLRGWITGLQEQERPVFVATFIDFFKCIDREMVLIFYDHKFQSRFLQKECMPPFGWSVTKLKIYLSKLLFNCSIFPIVSFQVFQFYRKLNN